MAKRIKRSGKIQPIKPIKNKKKKRVITAANVGTSKIEKEFMQWLLLQGICVSEQHQIGYKFYDFIIKDTKILIEFHGSYWHGSPEIYTKDQLNSIQKKSIQNDRYKKYLAQNSGYEIIYIWEHHFNKDKDKVKKYLIDEIAQLTIFPNETTS